MSIERRRQMIEPQHPQLSVVRQCELVSISRSGFYHRPASETPLNLGLMRPIDVQFLEAPWYGSRQMARHLRRESYTVGRKRVRRLMAKMGLAPICQRPLSDRGDGLGDAEDAGLAGVKHHGGEVLPRGAGRGAGAERWPGKIGQADK